MSKVKVYDIEAGLPLYVVKDKTTVQIKEKKDVEINSFYTDLGEKQTELEQQNIQYDVANDDDPIPGWVKVNSAVGQFGEILAMKHLEVEYPGMVKLVSGNARIGYDIEVYIDGETHAFEVKTTTQNNNKFYITQNELRVANKKRNGYHIMFIKIDDDEKTISGHIIDNPIETLEIDYVVITQMTRLSNIEIKADRFIVNINERYILNKERILLNSYISKVRKLLNK
ncbi:hypothetical protein QFZ81_005762 [Paenibacillus sp. V4I9]|uniref:protein NO VEIN domain-containing protein n=1 Tax=Paenibacillus sp. V4I9 TaxID=3042308 RepID=UPI00278487CA|nr:DUF3883 domain-containing protein [Paenibacillus sp. V4I9]MDQ0890674.1 hypothetical protein [Paenibacillus sp. V4I9]